MSLSTGSATPSPGVAASVLALTLMLSSGASFAQRPGQSQAATAEGTEAQVDCLLPSEIRRYGQEPSRLAPRRVVRTTARDCTERNGEVVVVEGR